MYSHHPLPRQSDDQPGHELHRTAYGQNTHTHPNHTQLSDDQNAFGDDSDSEDQHQENGQPVEENVEFDVYKDFNNQGVRYVTLLNNNDEAAADEKDDLPSDHPSTVLHTPTSPLRAEKGYNHSSINHSTELGSSTHHPQPSPGKERGVKFAPGVLVQEEQSRKRRKKRGWRVGAIVAFITIMLLGIAIFFLMPRQPFISYETPIAFSSTNSSSAVFSASNPTNFSFDAQLQFSLDGRTSYLPGRLSHLEVLVNDLGSTPDAVRVGKGKLTKTITVSAQQLTPVSVDLHFEYLTRAPSDALWQAWHKACGNIAASTINGTNTRPALQLYIEISFKILGMIGKKADSTQINGVTCPVELPAAAS